MKLFIKNMVSLRCKIVVKAELERLQIPYTYVELGEVEIPFILSLDKYSILKSALLKSGLELMEDKNEILMEKVKLLVIEMIHYDNELPCSKISYYLSEKLHYNYTYLSNTFTKIKGISLRQFIQMHKIERVKELLIYKDLNINEIACKLNYSSTAHLSAQFKKVTGLTPSLYKTMNQKERSCLENVGSEFALNNHASKVVKNLMVAH